MAVWRRFSDDRCLQLSASLTFTTLFALVPVFTIVLTIFTALPAFQDFLQGMNSFFARMMLPPMVSKPIVGMIERFAEQATGLRTLSLVVFAASAVTLMANIEWEFNHLWRVRRPRPFLRRALIYLGLLTLGPLALGASLWVTSYLVTTSLGDTRQLPGVKQATLQLVPIAVMAAAFTLLYFLVPNRRVHFRHAILGGIAAAVMFDLAKRAFAYYLGAISTYAIVYGAFAAFPIFLLWIYLSWVITILGAVITSVLPEVAALPAPGAQQPSGVLRDGLAVLRALVLAEREADSPAAIAIAIAAGMPLERCEEALEKLAQPGWVTRLPGERWALGPGAAEVTVGDVWRQLVLIPEGGRDSRHEPIDAWLSRAANAADAALREPIRSLADDLPAPPSAPARTRAATPPR